MSNKQSSVDKEFVSYEQALALKELGFDEPCFAIYIDKQLEINATYQNHLAFKGWVASPTFSQAFRWFRDKKLLGLINPIDDWNIWAFSILAEDCMSPFFEIINSDEYKSYEEAEIECLKKLIEIANEK